MIDPPPSERRAMTPAAQVETLRGRVIPALENFLETSRDLALRTAASDGWPEQEAQWIELHMREPLLRQIAAGVEAADAFRASYDAASRALTVHVFDRTVAEGKSRMTAFLLLVELTNLMAGRRGETAPAYTDALLQAGCEAVEAAAREGRTTEDQIGTGFAMMRELAQWQAGDLQTS